MSRAAGGPIGRRGGGGARALVAALAAVLAACFASPARAQGAPQIAPQIQVGTDADTVGVGDLLHVEMSATSADTTPDDPRPGATPGFVLRGQSQSPSQTHISINGSRSDQYTLVVDWTFQAQRAGTFSLGPASVDVGGTRWSSRPISVRVVPAGQAPQRRAPAPPQGMQLPFGFSPFDPWRGLMPDLDTRPPPAPQPIAIDPKLALAAPLGPVFFLHATVDKASAVVGEQVTFSVLSYRDVSSFGLEIDDDDLHDAQAADFVKHPLRKDDQEPSPLGYASFGGRTWEVKLVRRWALFPLRAGDLAIGPMSVRLTQPRSVAGSTRRTEALHVRVTDPPQAGRPPGYALGDVGRFTLSARVDPRRIEQDGAVGVHVELSGTGNVPAAIAPGAREGVEWLAPEVREDLGPRDHDAYGGKRTFDFVVRVHRSGSVDLGDLALPYWDPAARRYEVARASLGAVQVTPSPAGARASAEPPEPVLPGLPPPRAALDGPAARRAHADDSPLFWLGLGAWPAAFGIAVAGRAAGRRAARAWRVRRASPAADLKARMSSAEIACRGAGARGADAAIARALEAATIAHVGVSVRAAVGDEVIDRLERAGVAREAASRLAALLRECEAARFAPGADGEADAAGAARERWARAQGVIRSLEKRA